MSQPGRFERWYMRRFVLLWMPVFSALLITASFHPFSLGFLAWVGLAPFLLALRQSGPMAAAGHSILFAFLFSLGAFGWAGKTAEIGLPTFLCLIAPPISVYYITFGLIYSFASKQLRPWAILWAPALWVTLEYIRSNFFFLALPWNILAHSQYLYPSVIQIADFAGEFGVSFLIVMVNQFLSEIPELITMRKKIESSDTDSFNSRRYWKAQCLIMIVTVGFAFAYGIYWISIPEDGRHLKIAVIQANVLTRDDMPLSDQSEHLRVYEGLTKMVSAESPDLIAWPASSLPAPIKSSRLVRYKLRQLVSETGAYLLVGGSGRDKFSTQQKQEQFPYSNSEFLIAPSGRIEGQYSKIRLVPFNEYLPLQGKLTWPRWITPLQKSYTPGEEHTLFQVSNARFGVPICWESMFPDFFRQFVKKGANFMVCATNEGFYGKTAAPYQTLATNVFRAVENRVAIARASPTGISAIINPKGEIVDRIRGQNGEDLFISGFLVENIPLSTERTFYTLYGDIFAWAAVSITIFIIISAIYRKNRSQ